MRVNIPYPPTEQLTELRNVHGLFLSRLINIQDMDRATSDFRALLGRFIGSIRVREFGLERL